MNYAWVAENIESLIEFLAEDLDEEAQRQLLTRWRDFTQDLLDNLDDTVRPDAPDEGTGERFT